MLPTNKPATYSRKNTPSKWVGLQKENRPPTPYVTGPTKFRRKRRKAVAHQKPKPKEVPLTKYEMRLKRMIANLDKEELKVEKEGAPSPSPPKQVTPDRKARGQKERHRIRQKRAESKVVKYNIKAAIKAVPSDDVSDSEFS